MLTYWETLTAIQSNVPVNDSYAKLWGKKSRGGYTVVTYIGTLPATLTGTKAGYLHRYKIYGDTVQTGTPTPENPIYPSECGELETTGAHAGQYKLPLTSAGQDVDIYLGESQVTRRIKKLVLTGEETWNFYEGVNIWQFYTGNIVSGSATSPSIMSNIVEYGVTANTRAYYDYGAYLVLSGRAVAFQMRGSKDTLVDVAAWKAYLAAQYATGTPVTVWYVLDTPETGTLNEPLRKIGDYADTIDSTQTSAQIPTTANSTTISWAGEGLAPSEVELKYEKWR